MRTVGGRLVYPGRIRERTFEHIIVPDSYVFHGIGKTVAFGAVKFRQACHMPPWYYHCLERPYRPEGHECGEMFIFVNHPRTGLKLDIQIVSKKYPSRTARVFFLVFGFLAHFFRYGLLRPYLTVRMRIGIAHQLAFVLEYLNVAYPVHSSQFGILSGPYVHYFTHVRHVHFGQGEAVVRRKVYNPAYPALAPCHKQPVKVVTT